MRGVCGCNVCVCWGTQCGVGGWVRARGCLCNWEGGGGGGWLGGGGGLEEGKFRAYALQTRLAKSNSLQHMTPSRPIPHHLPAHLLPPPTMQSPHYMAFAVSAAQHFQLSGAIGVAVRMQRGPITVMALQRDLATAANADPAARPGALLEVSDRMWAFTRNIRGTAAYWQSAGMDVFAMLRHLGPPTWFVTLSADDMGWDDLFLALANPPITDPDQQAAYLQGLSRADKRALLAANPVGAARHFSNRYKHFLKWLHDAQPLGEVSDYFWRVEFQRRGSPHVHFMLWIRGAPQLNTTQGLAEAPAFIDRYVSTTIPPAPDPATTSAEAADHAADLRALVQRVQQHRHTDTCRRGRQQCRFAYPKPLSNHTRLRTNADVTLRCARGVKQQYRAVHVLGCTPLFNLCSHVVKHRYHSVHVLSPTPLFNVCNRAQALHHLI